MKNIFSVFLRKFQFFISILILISVHDVERERERDRSGRTIYYYEVLI